MCVVVVVNRGRNRAAGYLVVEGARHLGKKCVPINKSQGDDTSSNIPLQGGQALTCGDGGQEEVLRDEVTRDEMVLGCIVPGPRGAVQGQVGWTTF